MSLQIITHSVAKYMCAQIDEPVTGLCHFDSHFFRITDYSFIIFYVNVIHEFLVENLDKQNEPFPESLSNCNA